MTTGKTTTSTRWTFVDKVMALLYNMLSSFVKSFISRSKSLLISWLQSPSAVILESQKIKSVTVSLFPHLFAMKWWNWMPWYFDFWMLNIKPAFSLPSFTFIKRLFRYFSLSAIKVVSSAYLSLFIFSPDLDSSLCFIQPSISDAVLCM